MNKNVWLLSGCQALLVTGNVLLVSIVALIGQSIAPSPAMTTLPVATQFIGLMLATIPASLVMGRIGRKNGFYLGNCFGILGAIVCILSLSAQQFYLFSLGTLLLGIGIGFGTLYRFAAVEVCDEAQKSKAISMVMAGGVIAALIGPSLAVHSQHLFGDIPFVGGFVGLLALYIIALIMLCFIDIPHTNQEKAHGNTLSHHSEPERPLKVIITQPAFITAVVVGMVSYVVMNLLMTATPLAMHRYGFDFKASAHVIEWHVLGMFVPSFFTGNLISRFGVHQIMYAGVALVLACIAINLHGISEWHFLVALVLLGIGWNFMFISATQLVTSCYRASEKAKSQAANEFMVFSMVTVSALSSGWMEATFGWQAMNWAVLPIVLGTLLVMFVMQKRQTQVTYS